MKILISGATGFIGKNLIKRLLLDGHSISALIRSSTNKKNVPKNISCFTLTNNGDDLVRFLEQEKYDGVIHLASLFLPHHEMKDISNLIDSNILFSTTLLEAAHKANVSWFINTGTIWQNYESKKYSPVNLYAATKQAFEDIAQYYIETSSINFVTIKLSDTFGPGDTRQKIFNLLLKTSKNETTLDMSPGEQIIDISYIENITDGYSHMINLLSKDLKRKLHGKSFVLYSDKRLTLKKMVSLFEKIAQVSLKINWGGKEYRKREIMIPWSGGKPIPGWKPTVSLEKGIEKTLNELM
ncbi:MAG: NAD(P)-dependent oxidoreductase [Candidatus Pacebacteria bacterium]|nr:NAD(P)-dependent oxidoreductase [Candidatus Paceibacterota bacterium]